MFRNWMFCRVGFFSIVRIFKIWIIRLFFGFIELEFLAIGFGYFFK